MIFYRNKTFLSVLVILLFIVSILLVKKYSDVIALSSQKYALTNDLPKSPAIEIGDKNQEGSTFKKINKKIQNNILLKDYPALLKSLNEMISYSDRIKECTRSGKDCNSIEVPSLEDLKFYYFLRAETRWEVAAAEDSNQRDGRDTKMPQEVVNTVSGALLETKNDYTRALEIDPDNKFSPSNQRILNRRALLSIVFAQYDQALQDFNQSLIVDSTYQVTYFYRGRLKILYTQDKNTGCEDLTKALNNPKDVDGLINREALDLINTYCK